MKSFKNISILILIFTIQIKAQERVIYTINDGWRFAKNASVEAQAESFDDSSWELANIPHTWNNADTNDDTPGYYRGSACYRRIIFIDKKQENKHANIFFEGANQELKLYVNGQYVGEHKGGYTRICFDITKFLHYGDKNKFAVKVDNSYNLNIPPLSADFTFYGGIYRNVYLQFNNGIHLSTNDYASTGVYVKTPKVTNEEGIIDINALIQNETNQKQDIIIENTICDASGKMIKRVNNNVNLESNSEKPVNQKGIKISSPILWDIDNPYLYKLYTRVYDKSGKILLDEVSNPIGFRWFRFDSEEGFFLNGKYRKLIGTNRHQDFLQKGNALRDEMHVRDILLLKQMGGNFLRVSHYPQDPTIMEMCDKLGIVTSVEIPVVNAITATSEFLDNSVEMAKEMVRQNFNHPSVMIWGYMNEILLKKPFEEEEKLKQYFLDVNKVAQTLENTIRHEDPTRYTMIAFHNDIKSYEAAKLTDIPMIQGWNLYQGWYEPDINDFQRTIDKIHSTNETKPLIVTEYGAGVDSRLHSYIPERFDFTQEYGLVYHRHYLKEIMSRKFISGSNVWNLNDFYSESRIDATPHINNKGLTGLNRESKDTYLFYKVSLTNKPLVLIGNREWKTRGGVVNTADNTCKQRMPVFSNLPNIELFVNGNSFGSKKSEDNTVFFDVPFIDGTNVIEAVGKVNGQEIRDLIHVNFKLIPSDLQNAKVPFNEMNVMLGSQRYFEDRDAEMVWIPEQEYKPVSWGYIGGEPYRRKTGIGTMLGSDIDILGTDNDPIFQTQRVGLKAFRADVPDGEYSIYLYWAELDSDKKREVSIYNLDNKVEASKLINRSFDVTINGAPIFEKFNIARDYGIGRAIIKKVIVNIKNGQGLNIEFKEQEGEPVLNAIRLYRIY